MVVGLLALGVAKGDRVDIWAPNVPEWVLAQFATARIGAILVNINPAYRSHELSYVLQQAGVRTLISAQSFKTSDYRAMVEQVRSERPTLVDVVYLGTIDWDGLVAGGSAVPDAALADREAQLAFDDPINIQYTSGTTGSRRVRRCRITTSSTTGTSSLVHRAGPSRIGSAFWCPSTTASAWSWATWVR
jgi:fatty-acyl-CoA synthase